MGVMSMIAKAKGKFHQRRMDVLEKRTDKIRAENLKRAELTEAKQKLREAQQIKEDLRADQMQRVEKAPPSKLRRMGQGMAKHMKQQKAKGGGLKVGAIPSSGSRGLQVGGSGSGSSPFGGTKNLDVGGSSSGGFSFGPSPQPKPEKKKEGTTITIRTR